MAHPPRRDVAGYLYGWAAECAFKFMMQAAGINVGSERASDPYYAHFEDLKQMFLDSPQARLASGLRRFAERSSFMQHWHTSMRYSDGKQIDPRWVDRWATDAKDTIEAIMSRASAGEFLPPIPPRAEGSPVQSLIQRLVRIGVFVTRTDGRYDMPDLFRVAARLLKKGGVAPT